ncbi:DUF1282 family protein [Pseudomonas sp. UL073]|uniref:DUF1282 family protein n=1 Tax=Zestomonas insulae TaxID=2809017 RepID=A0ABS2ICF9_9GAMM|nr:Yip1 family protein [Pseudomonas insulae]MBM7060700.1 DUF1282 family protein [Pseudomonas insulae]
MKPLLLTLFTKPDRAWHDIRHTEEQHHLHYLGHLLLFALIPAISLYIGSTLVGWSLAGDETVKLGSASALQLSVLLYAYTLLGVALMGGFLRYLTSRLEARPSLNECIAFMAYTAMPYFVAGLAALYPMRWLAVVVLGAASAYATYLLFIGLPTFLRQRQSESYFYFGATWGVGMLLLVTFLVSAILVWNFYLMPDYQRLTP